MSATTTKQAGTKEKPSFAEEAKCAQEMYHSERSAVRWAVGCTGVCLTTALGLTSGFFLLHTAHALGAGTTAAAVASGGAAAVKTGATAKGKTVSASALHHAYHPAMAKTAATASKAATAARTIPQSARVGGSTFSAAAPISAASLSGSSLTPAVASVDKTCGGGGILAKIAQTVNSAL
eukprot:TRINITY_DN67264_c7_g1_i1.p2 TRINITY_DN67264_c7_g1~~TRINITY_DN67264_c7_g1_i1.p2  ORF type:complete len:179 (+),score=24.54 TRINITY_DN67264_c7_g1_i1:35-571(+)